MSNITDLKEDFEYRQRALPANLEEHELETVWKLLDSNDLLQRYLTREKKVSFLQGMNNACNTLFRDSIREL
jgi:hypothetical protein